MTNLLKIEIGGGRFPRGDGFINVDQTPNADKIFDLDTYPWPFDDDTVGEVYSSHCLEHLKDPFAATREICRMCVVGAPVEIRVPHPASHLAMTYGHLHVFSPIQVVNTEVFFPDVFTFGKKRFRVDRIEYQPTILLEIAKRERIFAHWTDQQIMRWIPGTCHECRFFFTVQEGYVNRTQEEAHAEALRILS